MDSLLVKIEQTNRRHRLFSAGDKILVALSGGPDSVALFHLLCVLAPKYNLTIAAAHIDHGLRISSNADRQFCRMLCKAYGVKFHAKKINIASYSKKHGLGIEEAGRNIRYAYFEDLCREHGYNKIATGHTADDSAETFLFNLVRGADLGGLSGIMPKRHNIIRPLIEIEKTELLNFLKTNGLSFRIDKSNLSGKYSRNVIRHELIPLLKKLNPQALKHVATAAEKVRSGHQIIERVTDYLYSVCRLKETDSEIILDLRKLPKYYTSLENWILLRAYFRLTGNQYRPVTELIERAINLKRSGASVRIDSQVVAYKKGDLLVLTKPIKRFASAKIRPGEKIVLGESGFDLECEVEEKVRLAEIMNNHDENRAFIDSHENQNLIVRNIKAGDKFKPLGMKGVKKIVDYLQDKGVSSIAKAAVPVVTVDNHIAWVVGYGISEDFKITSKTKRVLKFKMSFN
jgi:tRNA(Ile)-lysidine synthase